MKQLDHPFSAAEKVNTIMKKIIKMTKYVVDPLNNFCKKIKNNKNKTSKKIDNSQIRTDAGEPKRSTFLYAKIRVFRLNHSAMLPYPATFRYVSLNIVIHLFLQSRHQVHLLKLETSKQVQNTTSTQRNV